MEDQSEIIIQSDRIIFISTNPRIRKDIEDILKGYCSIAESQNGFGYVKVQLYDHGAESLIDINLRNKRRKLTGTKIN